MAETALERLTKKCSGPTHSVVKKATKKRKEELGLVTVEVLLADLADVFGKYADDEKANPRCEAIGRQADENADLIEREPDRKCRIARLHLREAIEALDVPKPASNGKGKK